MKEKINIFVKAVVGTLTELAHHTTVDGITILDACSQFARLYQDYNSKERARLRQVIADVDAHRRINKIDSFPVQEGDEAILQRFINGCEICVFVPKVRGALYSVNLVSGLAESISTPHIQGIHGNKFHSGMLPVQKFSNDLVSSCGTSEKIIAGIDLIDDWKRLRLSLGNVSFPEVLTRLQECGLTISEKADKQIFFYGIHWPSWLALIMTGRDPEVEMTNLERAETIALAGAANFDLDDFTKPYIEIYGELQSKFLHDKEINLVKLNAASVVESEEGTAVDCTRDTVLIKLDDFVTRQEVGATLFGGKERNDYAVLIGCTHAHYGGGDVARFMVYKGKEGVNDEQQRSREEN